MTRILFYFVSGIVLFQAACTGKRDKQTMIADLKQTELNFSNASVKNGMGKAFVAFADSDVVKLNDGMFPIIGKKQLDKIYGKDKSHFPFQLEWSPERVDVAESGDLGYTYGNWKMTTKTQAGKDTVYYGNYMTVWKKQDDGTWKYVIDGGNNTPDPDRK